MSMFQNFLIWPWESRKTEKNIDFMVTQSIPTYLPQKNHLEKRTLPVKSVFKYIIVEFMD